MEEISGEPTPPSLDPNSIPSTRLLSAPNLSFQHVSLPRRAQYQATNILLPNTDIPLHLNNLTVLPKPTQSQRLAAIALQKFDLSEVLASLKTLRSLDPPHRIREGAPGTFSQQELDALFEFEYCSDDKVTAWLELGRNQGQGYWLNDRGDLAPPASTTSLPILQKHSTKTTQKSCAGSSARYSAPNSYTLTSTAPSSFDHDTFVVDKAHGTLEKRETSPASSTKPYHRWCTLCDDSRSFRTSDGYKRHMREHETKYQCMPAGAVDNTAAGPKCCFCGQSRPDQKHLDNHAVLECKGAHGQPHSYTRMSGLITHLENVHGVRNGRWLAEQWRNMNKNSKKYYGCGLCVSCFPSLIEQTGHIDTEHWSRSAKLCEWQPDKVILSLLHQPKVHDAWEHILAKYHISAHTQFTWDESKIGGLQRRLEQSAESPDQLASWAFTQSLFYEHYRLEIESSISSEYTDNDRSRHAVPSTFEVSYQRPQLPQRSASHTFPTPSTPASYPPQKFGHDAQMSGPFHDSANYGPQFFDVRPHQPRGPGMHYTSYPDTASAQAQGFPDSGRLSNQSFDGSSNIPWNRASNPLYAENSLDSHANSNFAFDPTDQDVYTSTATHKDLFEWSNAYNQVAHSLDYSESIPTQPPCPQAPQDQTSEPLDTAEVDQWLSSHRDTALPIHQDLPDRRTEPFSVTVPKRKHSGSTTSSTDTGHEVNMGLEVNTGQRSRYRNGDDHLRRKRRSDINAEYHP